MEKINYIDQIRREVSNHIQNQIIMGYTLEQSIQSYLISFYQIDKVYHKQNYILKTLILGVGFVDAYKIYSYKQKNGLINDSEVELLGKLIALEDINDLLAEASADPEFLFCLIATMNEFYKLNILEKIMLMNSLSYDEHGFLVEFLPFHIEDIDKYNIEVTLETLKSAYIEQKVHQVFVADIDFEEAILMSLCGFIKNLLKYDYQNAKKLICDIAILDYASLCILAKKRVQCGYVEERIDLYQNNEGETILNTLLNDEDILKCAIYVTIMTLMNGCIERVPLSKDWVKSEEAQRLSKKLSFEEDDYFE